MNHVGLHALDDIGRVLLPYKLTTQLNWEKGRRLAAKIVDETIELHCNLNGEVVIDELRRIQLPKETREFLGWEERDELMVSANGEDQIIRLAMGIKYAPACVFCSDPNVIITVNGGDICKDCVNLIQQSGHQNPVGQDCA